MVAGPSGLNADRRGTNNFLSKKALKISGGETNSFRDSIISMGLISTYTLIFEKWISLRETNMSYMMKIADKYINNAEEFASNLKII